MSGARPDKSKDELQQQYYCEYVCNGNEWWLIGANVQSGYYCPDEGMGMDSNCPDPPGGCTDGEKQTISPHPYTTSNDDDQDEVGGDEGFFYGEYEYNPEDGTFRLTKANSPRGYYSPPDLIKYLKKNKPSGSPSGASG